MNTELETARKKAIASLAVKIILCIAAGVAGTIVIKEDSPLLSILSFIVAGAIAWGLISYITKNRAYARFITLYKSTMIQAALNGNPLCDDMDFKPDYGIAAELVNSTGMLSANKFFSNCFLSGTYNGVQFCQAEVRNVRADRSGSALEYDGTLITFPTALPEAGQTNIYDKKADIALTLPGSMASSGNAEFDAIFNISSNNTADLKHLVTPDFMHSLMSLSKRMNRKIALTVRGGRMFVFLTGKQSVIRANLFKKYDDTMKTAILDELNAAKLFIDAFGAAAGRQ